MKNPKTLKYTKEHQWIRVDGNIGTIGITDFAQNTLKDIVFVELPEIGKKVEQSKTATTIESIKSVSDICSPVSGEVIEVNESLNDTPEKVNKDPYGGGWIFKIKITNPKELDELMSSDEYTKIIKAN